MHSENEEEGMHRDMCHRKNKSSLATGWMWWGSGQGRVGLGTAAQSRGLEPAAQASLGSLAGMQRLRAQPPAQTSLGSLADMQNLRTCAVFTESESAF